jgi:glycosyltransferase involved in cell wall biosynthesis
VVGDAGILVDPFDVSAIAAAIERIVDDSDFRHQLSVRGLARSRIFDWRETARRTLNVYEQVVRGLGRAETRQQGAAS